MARKATNAPEITAPGAPADPTYLERWKAIRLAGGFTEVARKMKPPLRKGESVRMWTISRDPSAAQARQLVALSGNSTTLAKLLPDVYGGLTVAELGYEPK